MILIFIGIICFIYIKNEVGDKEQSNQIKNETKIKIINLENKINLLENKLYNLSAKFNEQINNNSNKTKIELSEISFEKFDENIFQQIKNQQMEFCNNQSIYVKMEFEKQIKLIKASLLNKIFDMYVYKREDTVSMAISKRRSWEGRETQKLINALNYYSSLKNITNDNIYILDIGSNVGWYTLFLGKLGYNILAFEPSDVNVYILRKSFCLNQDLNITLIKKGLYTEEKQCDFYISRGNIGDGWVFCDKNSTIPSHLIKSGETYLTKLGNYIEFLSTRNLALIKIDIEGSEGKAIESGIELLY
jgi:FkbM family methyltransferase